MFYMYRHTIVAPKVLNDYPADWSDAKRRAMREAGEPIPASGYPEALRAALLEAGISGWTEYETVGYWRGKREPGTTFEIFLMADDPHKLGAIARRVMPDQDAIQVTVDTPRVELHEY